MEKNRNANNNKFNYTDTTELEKSKAHIVVEVIEYVPNAVVSKTILRKITGNITAMSFDTGEELGEKTTPFDTFVQIIDGMAEIIIGKKSHHLKLGNGIIIPAHESHCFNATEKFKMISTVIKSGYEE
jgi:quercetin dioxygenase-like cupin family protein